MNGQRIVPHLTQKKNMKAFNLLILSILALIFTSCRSVRQESKNSETITEITTETKTSYRDTVFYTPKSETSIKVPISAILEKSFNNDLKDFERAFKPQVFSQKNGNATARIRIEKDTIKVEAECDSIAMKAQIRKDVEKQYQSTQKKQENQKQEKTGFTIWDILSWCGVAISAGFALGKIIKI